MLNRTARIALFCTGMWCCAIIVFATEAKGKSQPPVVFQEISSRPAAVEPATPVATANQSNLPSASREPKSDMQLASYPAVPPDEEEQAPAVSDHWPTAEALVEQIQSLQNIPEIQTWSKQTVMLLQAMSLADPNSIELDRCLDQLKIQLQAVPKLAAAISNRGDHSVESINAHCEVSRLAYRLQRRIAVWQSLRKVATRNGTPSKAVFHSFGSGQGSIQPAAFSRINFESLDPNWVSYLKLKELQSSFGSLNPNPTEQRTVARSVLARIYSPLLKPEQANYIQQVIDPMIISSLKAQASQPFDQIELLKQLENYEAQSSSLAGYYLNDQYQNLLWSTDPAEQAIASEIQTHYRNANFRIVVSERLLNRMIPELPSTESPVAENIKGARVSGRSHVSNQLQVDLIPNVNQIQLQLETSGDVRSNTIARTKSFRIQNIGKAQFQVVQQFTISPMGINTSSQPQALSKANQYVVGLESKMDDLPIVGWMARKLAAKKLRAEGPDNDRLFQRTVESSAENQMQQQVNEQLAKIRQLTYAELFHPLFEMELEPEALQMASTDDQVVMRYRLAGRDQMAANTSRPRDSGQSLMSFQMHQSALNNAIARIGLNGNEFTIEELTKHIRDVVGMTELSSAEQDSDRYAEVGFAYFDPIHIDLQDDQLNITLNLKSLKVGTTGKTWKNISLTAAYRFAIDGTTVELQQDDEGTRIKGRRLRFGDKAAISAVMKVLFQQRYSINVLPEKMSERIDGPSLEVSQFVLSDGWLAVSIDDRKRTNGPKDQDALQRTGAIRRLIQRR